MCVSSHSRLPNQFETVKLLAATERERELENDRNNLQEKVLRSQDWHALFRIIRDVPLTANFERPADKVLEGLDDSAAAVAPKAEAAEPAETLEADADAVAVEGVEVTDGDGGDGDGGTEGDGADGDGDDLFDPESPEGPGDFEPQSEMAHYQLLQHVDSPEHEDPDEAHRQSPVIIFIPTCRDDLDGS